METKHTIITVHTSDTSYRVAPKSEKVFKKELDAIQQRCTVRTIDLNAQEFPNAYKYTPYSTIAKVKCTGPRSWAILSVKRDITQSRIYECKTFTDLQKK